MQLTSQNTVTWFGSDTAAHKAQVDKWAALNFRTTSLTIYGDPSNPTFGAVMVKRPSFHAEWQVFPRTQAQLQQDFDAEAAKGSGPYIITACGPGNNATFAASFMPMNPIPFTQLNMTHDMFETTNAARHALGEMLLWFDAFGEPGDMRFCAIWGPNPGRTAWSVESWNVAAGRQDFADPAATAQQRFNALNASGARPAHVTILPNGEHATMYVDTTMGAWDTKPALSPSDFQTYYNQQTAAGKQPLQFSASGNGNSALFAAIFVTRDDTDPLPSPIPSQGPVTVAAIDAVIQDFMTKENVFGAALAITKGTQLVYAKGYTNAPAGYPAVTPQTLFRQASISKVFTGVAMWKLLHSDIKLADGSLLSLNTPIQSILNLKQPDGAPPVDERWPHITIKHLLQSDSGINQGIPYMTDAAAAASNVAIPPTAAQLLSYATTLPLTGNPGDPNNAVYGNFDYILLSNIVAVIHGSGVGNYVKAVTDLVLTPLGLTHTRGAVSLVGKQLPGEAHYHMRVYDPQNGWALYPLEVLPTVVSNDGVLVASQYGGVNYELFAGAGGMSSSVVDVARLGAMFSDTSATALLGSSEVQSLMQAVLGAESQKGPDGKGSHGYYGLDWAQSNGGNPVSYTAEKGGWLPAQGTVLHFTTGGYGFALAINCNADIHYDWLTPISQLAAAQAWSANDLFATTYGMKSLGSAPQQQQAIVAVPKQTIDVTMAQVQASMAKR